MNIHGCQPHPKVAIYVVKQLKIKAFVRDCSRVSYSGKITFGAIIGVAEILVHVAGRVIVTIGGIVDHALLILLRGDGGHRSLLARHWNRGSTG